MPSLEDFGNNLEAFSTDGNRRAAAIDALLEVAFEMRPANLPLEQGPKVVDAPAVTAQDAVDGVPQQRGQAQATPLAVDDEGRYGTGGSHPQPAFAAGLFPTGLIDVLDWGGLDRGLGFGMCRLQGGADFLLQRADRAQRQWDREDIRADLFGGAFGEMVMAGQIDDRRRQARATTVGVNFRRDRHAGDFPAARTGAGVSLIFGDFRLELR